MAKKIKKTYTFALVSALYLSLFFTLILGIILYINTVFNFYLLIAFALLSFTTSFIILQYRIERFIFRKIKQIYEDLTLLEATDLRGRPITTDMATLTSEIDKFARNKKLEIEALKIREEYRKEFIGNVSHELKTPLFTVQGYLLTLIDGAYKDKKVRDKYLKNANKGVERLIYIVRDLDMITKLEVGDLRLEIEEFNIVELIQSVFDLLEMKASKMNITLLFDVPYKKAIMVKADKEKIQQVLVNLVVNSIKYGRSGGTTEVSIENLIKNKVIVRITDNGEGIRQRDIPRLFERFYRVDKSGSRKEGGSGLGLAIVKHIIEGHNEKIYIESEFGVGSEFSFTLEKTE